MYIPQIIADKFYEHFEQELYDFTFMFKTESYLNNQSRLHQLQHPSHLVKVE